MNAIVDAIKQAPPAEPWLKANVPIEYQLNQMGLYLLREGKEGYMERIRIADPIWVEAQARNAQLEAWACLIMWIDMDGNLRQGVFQRSRLHEHGSGLAGELASKGLNIEVGKERQLCQYLAAINPCNRFRLSQSLGWVGQGEQLAYLLPGSLFQTPALTEQYVYQPEKHCRSAQTMTARSSLENWQLSIAARCEGNPFLLFALCVAFMPPLLKFAHLDSGGFHIYGRSSHGKTTLAQVAASVWGHGGDPAEVPEESFIRRWNSTANALEGIAASHNDGLLVLDELGTCPAKDCGQLVYNLMGGQGKSAMDSNRNLKDQRRWRLQVISTGEIPFQAKLEEDKKQAKAGQLLRMLDIPVPAEGLFFNTHGMPANEFARILKTECAQHFGTAGPAFLQALLEKCPEGSSAISAIVKTALQKAVLALPGVDEPEKQRVKKRFELALASGWLASDLGIIPISQENITNSVAKIWDSWLEANQQLNDIERGLQQIKEFILRHKSRFFWEGNGIGEDQPRDLVGYTKDGMYLFTEHGFKEACQGYNYRELLKALKERGFLFQNNGTRYKSKFTIHAVNDKRLELYAIKAEVLEL